MCDAEHLILLVQNRPCLYNSKIKEETEKNIIEKVWREVARELECPVSECKRKWAILRNSYIRSIRNINVSESKRKPWYLASAMSFIAEHVDFLVNKTPQPDNSLNTSSDKSNVSSSSSSEDEEEEAPKISNKRNKQNAPAPPAPQQQPLSRKRKAPSETPSKAPPQITAAVNNNTDDESRMDYIEIPQLNQTTEEDPNLTFFKSILPDMRRLSQSKQRKLKQDLLIKLYRYLDNNDRQ